MANISDIIEEFILSHLEEDNQIDLSRNDLADFFGCVPSQINYVLSTRFGIEKGFVTKSKRGGGGFIRLARVNLGKNEYISNLIGNVIGNKIDLADGNSVIDGLMKRDIISDKEAEILKNSISHKSLGAAFKSEDIIRANLIKNVIMNLLKEDF
ncbi:MAG: CtsR family transcriptional regulator [Clostridia bacterium]